MKWMPLLRSVFSPLPRCWSVNALEEHSAWFIFAFAGSCGLGSAYGFLQGAWPFGVIEAIWALVALRRWYLVHKVEVERFSQF
jgi:hypothetical protein